MNRALRCINCFLALFAVVVASASAADTIKSAHIDPLSGPFALIGESASRMIQASIDDVVLTGNWGADLSLLIKAGREAGLDVVYYTLNSHNAGMAAAIGKSGADQIRQVFTWHANIADNKLERFANDYRKRLNDDLWLNLPKLQIDMLAKAIDSAQSTDPVKVAKALRGMRFQGETGEAWMRPDDHQLIVAQYIATFTKAGGAVKYDVESTGYGWKTDVPIEGKNNALPTTCKMEIPK